MKRTHGTGVAATLVGSFLPTKVGEGIKTARVIKAILVLTMAALHLSIVPGSIGANQFVINFQLSGRCLKEGFQVALAAGKAIGEFKTVIGLDALHSNAFAGKMCNDLV